MGNLENKLKLQEQRVNRERQKLNLVKRRISAARRKHQSRAKFLMGFALLKRYEKGGPKTRENILSVCKEALKEADYELVERLLFDIPEFSPKPENNNE